MGTSTNKHIVLQSDLFAFDPLRLKINVALKMLLNAHSTAIMAKYLSVYFYHKILELNKPFSKDWKACWQHNDQRQPFQFEAGGKSDQSNFGTRKCLFVFSKVISFNQPGNETVIKILYIGWLYLMSRQTLSSIQRLPSAKRTAFPTTPWARSPSPLFLF